MAKKKTPTPKRKPAAIVVGANKFGDLYACPGSDGELRSHSFYAKDSVHCALVCFDAAMELGVSKLKPGQYIRFVQDGGVRKARRVKT